MQLYASERRDMPVEHLAVERMAERIPVVRLAQPALLARKLGARLRESGDILLKHAR